MTDQLPPDPYEDAPHTNPTPSQVPHCREAEESCVGCVLINPDAYFEVAELINSNDFYSHRHRWIWDAFVNLTMNKMAIDIMTVSDELDRVGKLQDVGGSSYLTSLISQVPSSLNISSYARIIEAHSVRRKMIEKANKIATLAYDESKPVEDMLHAYDQLVTQNSPTSSSLDETQDSDEASLELLEKIQGKIATGVLSHFPLFDSYDALGGFPVGATLLLGDSSFGKCLAKGTKVVMFDGTTKPVEDVVVGDFLMGVDSTPRRVLSLSSGLDEMYKINQVYGKDYVVNSRHILSLKRSTNRGGHIHGETLNVYASDVYARKSYYQTHYKCYKTGVEFDEKEVPLEPYFLGLWLGDGTSANSVITNPDQEIIDYIYQYADRLGLGVHTLMNSSKCPQLRITNGRNGHPKNSLEFNVMVTLKSIGVLNNKHIPHEYLCNSRKNRLSLLAGLLDSDGYLLVQSKHSYEITQKNHRLALDIKRLADSLGFRTTIVEKIAQSQNGTKVLVYRMNISGNVDEVPILVERKKAMPWTSYEDWQISGFKIESVGVGEYFGFSLDGDALFLLEDFTVTHNSTFGLQLCEQNALAGKVALYIGLESTNVQMVVRRVGGASGVTKASKKMRTASLTPQEEAALVNTITNDYQGKYSGRLKLNSAAYTIKQIETAVRNHKPAICVVDQISQIIDAPSTNPTVNLKQNFSRLKAIGKKYNCAMIVVHTISAEESKAFFAKNQKANSGNQVTQKNSMPNINAIPWASEIKFLTDVFLFLVPEANQKLSGASMYEIIIWILKDRDGNRFVDCWFNYDLILQWFTDKIAPYKSQAQRPSNPVMQQVTATFYQDNAEPELIDMNFEGVQ